LRDKADRIDLVPAVEREAARRGVAEFLALGIDGGGEAILHAFVAAPDGAGERAAITPPLVAESLAATTEGAKAFARRVCDLCGCGVGPSAVEQPELGAQFP
jgi:hypothetical protein